MKFNHAFKRTVRELPFYTEDKSVERPEVPDGLLKKYQQIPRKPVDFFGWMYYTLF